MVHPRERGTLCILVVDDELEALRILYLYLERRGHRVHQSHSGSDALHQIAGIHPDLVFVDLSMPEIDGFEVAKRIRHEPRLLATKIIALTAYDDNSHRQRAIYAGFDGYLVKPVAFVEVERTIERVQAEIIHDQEPTHPEC